MPRNKAREDDTSRLVELEEENSRLRQEVADLKAGLAQQEQMFMDLLDNLPIFAYISRYQNDNFIFEWTNSAAKIMTNGRVTEYLGHTMKDMFKEYPQFVEGSLKAYHSGQPVRMSMDYKVISTGEPKSVAITLLALPPDRIICLSMDMTEYLKARDALDLSQERLALLAQNLPGIVYLSLPEPGYIPVFINDKVEELTGYPKSAFLSGELLFSDIMVPEDAEPTSQYLQQAIENRRPFNMRYRLHCRDGRVIWVEEHGSPICNKEGKPIYIEGVIMDITQRQTMMQALNETKLRYELATRSARIGVWDLDMTNDQFYFDPMLKSLLGYDGIETSDEVGFWRDHIHRDDLGEMRQCYQEHLEGKAPAFVCNLRFFTKSGEIKWLRVHGKVIPDADGTPARVIGTCMDITQQQLDRLALQRSEERFRTMFEGSPISLWEGDLTQLQAYFEELRAQGVGDFETHFIKHPEDLARALSLIKVCDVNSASLRLFKAKSKAELMNNFGRIVHPQTLVTLRKEMAYLAAGGDSFWNEHVNVTMEGDEFISMAHLKLIQNHQGNLTRAIVSVQDITDRKKAGEALTRAKEVAEAALATKSQFLANISHEIRTPITTMLGMAELLDKTPLSAHQQRYVALTRQSGENLLRLFNDLLDFSRFETGLVELNPRPFSIQDLMAQVVSMLDHQAREKGLRLVLTMDEAVPETVVGDPDRISQVLLNLAGNALKFTEAGEISLRVRPVSSKQTGLFLFTVSDTGLGIPPDLHGRIFESFAQADRSIQRRYGGQGLGLPIARQLVGRMGGVICLESEPGAGATFSFTVRLEIPLDQDQIPTPHPPRARMPEGPATALNILVVDDLDTNRDLVKLLLDDTGFVFLEAEDGGQALETYASQSVDLILMDLMMPDMDGLEATRAIRRYEHEHELKPVPILAVSARAFVEDIHQSLAAGCDGHLPRPFSAAKLLTAILELRPDAAPRGEPCETCTPDVDPRLAPLIPKVLKRLQDLVEQGRGQIGQRDFKQLFRIGHSIKGLGASYGLGEMARLGERIEEQALAESGEEALVSLSQVQRMVGKWRGGA